MTDDVVAATMSRLTKDGLRPILCVGESSSVRSSGDHVSTVTAQLTAACEAIDPKKRHNFVVAYEPVWAIGTGETASADQVREMMTAIRAQLSVLSASEVPVLYGGSVSEDNAVTLLREASVDGFLVGGASLKAESFLAIARAGDDCYSQ
jgi:triosephosphate isomerase